MRTVTPEMGVTCREHVARLDGTMPRVRLFYLFEHWVAALENMPEKVARVEFGPETVTGTVPGCPDIWTLKVSLVDHSGAVVPLRSKKLRESLENVAWFLTKSSVQQESFSV